MRLSVLLLAAAAIAPVLGGCDSFELSGARHATLTYTDDARASYNEAMKSFRGRDWDDARALFGEIKKLFPYTTYARLSELRLADINFEQEKFSEAVTGYREFIQNHRSDPNVEYARYRVTKALFKDIDDTIFLPPQEERDQATCFEAYKEIRSYQKDYPNTRFPREEQYMYEVVVGRLVRHELYVARFYLAKENYDAAVARIEYALHTYGASDDGQPAAGGMEQDALILLGETYLKMHKWQDARQAFEAVVRIDTVGPNVIRARHYLEYLSQRGA